MQLTSSILLVCLILPISTFATVQTTLLYSNSFGVPGQNATFDYVVLGGGTAGLAIASRLAKNPDTSVAVIEAGGFYEIDNGNGSVIPALAPLQHVGSLPNDTQPLIDWGFVTVPQAWAEQVGDDSYLYENFLPYFERSCHLTPPNLEKRYPTNGTVDFDPSVFSKIGGPLQVSWSNWANPIATWARKAYTAAGMQSIPGFNSGRLIGNAWPSRTLNPLNQHRSSSQTSFLDDAMRNTDIVVYTQTLGKQILFSSNKTATGVQVVTAGASYSLSARKEVILSAGTFQSPQLLMVSGIGPRQILESHNITVLSDLPGVGQNLWDQIFYGVSFRVNVETSSRLSNDKVYAAQAAQDYLKNQTGPLTSIGAYVGFEKLPFSYRHNFTAATQGKLSTFPADWPEIEYLAENAFDGYNTNYTGNDPNDGYQYATISSALVAPLSRGNVSISSADTTDPPIINPNWLTDPADVEVAIAAFKRVRELWTLMNGTTIGEEYFPGTANVSSDEEILDFIRKALITVWHAAGTCKMGKNGDVDAVVDSKAKLKGVNSLRVVDASIFPLLPPGHPQATIYALAEKVAEDILLGL
ncbi:MAG: hypothetical protein Q9195_007872 [Heterodermia aff. obscurata]